MEENSTDKSTIIIRAPNKPRFVFEHVWKTGGTELCKLARANGWKVPDKPGCTLFIHPHQGWPKEDYDMIGNEGAVPSGEVTKTYKPQNEFINNTLGYLTIEPQQHENPDEDDHNNANSGGGVQWITTLRHPYSRTLSHYYHLKRLQTFENITLESFVTNQHGIEGGFGEFITNQQTRWHCGTGLCSNKRLLVTPQMLQHAKSNLEKMDAVLILEDMSTPDSCTRIQMKHILNFTTTLEEEQKQQQQQSLDDDRQEGNRTSSSASGSASSAAEKAKLPPTIKRSSKTNWDKVVRPYLDYAGRTTNETAVSGFGVVGGAGSSSSSSSSSDEPSLSSTSKHKNNNNSTRVVRSSSNKRVSNKQQRHNHHGNTMAALGLHNDMDMQLYGYAQHLCKVLAEKYEQQQQQQQQQKRIDHDGPATIRSKKKEENDTFTITTTTTTDNNNTTTTSNPPTTTTVMNPNSASLTIRSTNHAAEGKVVVKNDLSFRPQKKNMKSEQETFLPISSTVHMIMVFAVLVVGQHYLRRWQRK